MEQQQFNWILDGANVQAYLKGFGSGRYLVSRPTGGIRTFLGRAENADITFDLKEAAELAAIHGATVMSIDAVRRTAPVSV
jgi:hypothetical protein